MYEKYKKSKQILEKKKKRNSKKKAYIKSNNSSKNCYKKSSNTVNNNKSYNKSKNMVKPYEKTNNDNEQIKYEEPNIFDEKIYVDDSIDNNIESNENDFVEEPKYTAKKIALLIEKMQKHGLSLNDIAQLIYLKEECSDISLLPKQDAIKKTIVNMDENESKCIHKVLKKHM